MVHSWRKRRVATETPAHGALLEGIIKSYNRSTGCGFVNIEYWLPREKRNMYFHTQDMSPALQERAAQRDGVQGALVRFRLQVLRDGRWRAGNVEARKQSGAQAPGLAPASASAGATAASISATRGRPSAGGARSPQRAGVRSRLEIGSRVERLVATGLLEERARRSLPEPQLGVIGAPDLGLSRNCFSGALADSASYTGSPASAGASEPSPGAPTTTCAEHGGAGSDAAGHGRAQGALARMQCDWLSEDPNQLDACRGALGWLWPSTQMEIGWAYAERLDRDPARAGWLPFDRCQELSDGQSYAYVLRLSPQDTNKAWVSR